MKCPCCNGKYSYIDVITDDGQGPEELCGYCNQGEVNLWKYIYWKFCEKFLWKEEEVR